MKRMWVIRFDDRDRRIGKGLCPYRESGVPGLVLIRVRAGLWRVTHQASGLAVGPLLGLRKAMEFAAALPGDIDWTQPASRLSSKQGLADAALDSGDLAAARRRERAARAVELRWWRRSHARRGWSSRCRRVFGAG